MAQKVTGIPIEVQFHIFTEGGIEFVLDKGEIEAEHQDTEKARRDALKKEKTAQDETEKAIAKNQITLLDGMLERQKFLIDTILPACTIQKFDLYRPTYGTVIEAKSRPDITKETADGSVYTNEKRLVNLLLPMALKGPDESKPKMSDDEIADLHPDIGERLEAKLHGMLYPNANRIRFRINLDS